MYKLRDWVDEKTLNWLLSNNERAIEYLENHEKMIYNYSIFSNKNAIHIIEKRIQYDNHGVVNNNKNAVTFLRNNPEYMDYYKLCGQEHGIEFVDELIKNKELDKIYWCVLSRNPAAMHILNNPEYYTYINWRHIIYNKHAGELVKKNIHMVDEYWEDICNQPHLMDIIEQNMDKMNWVSLSKNYNAIHILEKNLDKINIHNLCQNKNGFELLLRLDHVFVDSILYHENIMFNYFDYCVKKDIPFNLIKMLSIHGYNEKHMEFLKNSNHEYLSMNPNIFEYDYKRMRETRQALLWYNDIKK